MHMERDYLRDNAFKRLEERLKDRCVFLDLIDLRQGVDTTKVKNKILREMRVLEVCLGEIRRSRPFIIAFIGDRYGYIPSDEQIFNAAQAAGMAKPEQVKGKSITELEILFGALENAQQLTLCWFFFRDVDRRGMPPEEADKYPVEQNPESIKKLNALKVRIENVMPERVIKYTLRWSAQEGRVIGIADFDAKVEEKLWPDLDTDTSKLIRMMPRTWQDAEARVLTDFISEHLRTYVDRSALEHQIVGFATSESISGGKQFLIMTGLCGAGKSSLFSKAFALFTERAKNKSLFLLAHAAGLFPGSEQIDRMMRRWVHELADFHKISDPLAILEQVDIDDETRSLPNGATAPKKSLSEEVEASFWKMIERTASKTRVVLLIDALDQFEPTLRAQYLSWIPSSLHANVRLIATSAPCEAVAHAAKSEMIDVRPIEDLSQSKAKEIAHKLYRELYHHTPCEPALEALLRKRQQGPSEKQAFLLGKFSLFRSPNRPMAYCNLLWLTLALHELNLLGRDDFEHAEKKFRRLPPAERIIALQLERANDLPVLVEDIYVHLFKRAERVCGSHWVKHFLSLLGISRSGLRESDLSVMLPQLTDEAWDTLQFANARRIFGWHVVQRGAYGQWGLAYEDLRSAIINYYIRTKDDKVALHGILGLHLSSLPSDDGLRINETMFHLLNLGDPEIAASYIAYMAFPDSDQHLRLALDAAIATIAETYQLATKVEDMAHIAYWLAQVLVSSKYVARVAHVFICNLDPVLTRIGSKKMMASRLRLLSDTLRALEGQLQTGCGDTWIKHDIARCCELLGNICDDIGASEQAQAYAARALALREKLKSEGTANSQLLFGLPVSYCSKGDSHFDKGEWAKASEYYSKAREVAENLCRQEPLNDHYAELLSFCYRKTGRLSFKQGDFAKAQKWFESALSETTRIKETQKSCNNEIECLNALASLFLAKDDLDQALAYANRAACSIEEIHAFDPQDSNVLYALSTSHKKQADIYLRMNNFVQAQQSLDKALKVLKDLNNLNPHVINYKSMMASVLIALGNTYRTTSPYKVAEDYYLSASAITKELCDRQPSNYLYVFDYATATGNLGLIYLKQLRKKEALDLLMKASNLLKTIECFGDFSIARQLEDIRHIILHTDWS